MSILTGSYTCSPLNHGYGIKGVHAGSMIPGDIAWSPSTGTPRNSGWTASGSVGLDTGPNTGQYWNYMIQYSTSEWRFTSHASGAKALSPWFRIPTTWMKDVFTAGTDNWTFKWGAWVGVEAASTMRLNLKRSATGSGGGTLVGSTFSISFSTNQHAWVWGTINVSSISQMWDNPYLRIELEKTSGTTGTTYLSSAFLIPTPDIDIQYQCYLLDNYGSTLYLPDIGARYATTEPFMYFQSTESLSNWSMGPYIDGATASYNSSTPLLSMARIEVDPWQMIACQSNSTVEVMTIVRRRDSGL